MKRTDSLVPNTIERKKKKAEQAKIRLTLEFTSKQRGVIKSIN